MNDRFCQKQSLVRQSCSDQSWSISATRYRKYAPKPRLDRLGGEPPQVLRSKFEPPWDRILIVGIRGHRMASGVGQLGNAKHPPY